MINLNCNKDRLVLRRIALEAKTEGGLILGDITSRENDGAAYGCIEASYEDNRYKVGEVVAFNPRITIPINWRGEYYELMRENDVFFGVPEEEMKTLGIKEYDASEGKEEVYSNPGNFQGNEKAAIINKAYNDPKSFRVGF